MLPVSDGDEHGHKPDSVPENSAEPDRALTVRHVRYRQGEVGESQRSVHTTIATADGLLTSACRQRFQPERMEDVVGGMPCVACVQRLASAQGQQHLVDEHGLDGLPD